MTLKCGFNHRHHPAIWEAKRLLDQGSIGKPLFARCVYGICGRPGYENEWRADPAQAAGGQFIEQGTHAIDLFRWFLGEVAEVACMTGVRFFEKQTLDDNAMAVFRMASGALASVHSSLTQWKNLFSFEVFGEDGYLRRGRAWGQLRHRETDRGAAGFRCAFPGNHYRIPRRRHLLARGMEGIYPGHRGAARANRKRTGWLGRNAHCLDGLPLRADRKLRGDRVTRSRP